MTNINVFVVFHIYILYFFLIRIDVSLLRIDIDALNILLKISDIFLLFYVSINILIIIISEINVLFLFLIISRDIFN